MKLGNWYMLKDAYGEEFIAEYAGRQKGFECCVCGKGQNAHCFNVYHGNGQYETWAYGNEHMPEVIIDMGIPSDNIDQYLNNNMK